MRLKEDTTSWKAQGLKIKLKLIPAAPKHHAKKNTRKWCKGKVGVEHDYELQIPPNESKTIAGFRMVPICKNCGRQDYRGVLYRQKDGSYGKQWHLNA